MSKKLVLCNGAVHSGNLSKEWEVLELWTHGPTKNVNIEINQIPKYLLRSILPRLEDLLMIAALVYAADNKLNRGSAKDVFATAWSRHITFIIPVRDLSFWARDDVKQFLILTLEFLTNDKVDFDFIKSNSQEGIPLLFDEQPNKSQCGIDSVILFSGGLDSLAATTDAVSNHHHPILISHRPNPLIDARQKDLVIELRKRFPGVLLPHISMWVNRKGGPRSIENSQRSRSFLFTSLGVVVAKELNITSVLLCDNGVVSINLPRSHQNVGTFLSRSTHPSAITTNIS